MKGAVRVAIVAAIGNLLQGWDNSVIAGSVLYIKKEFHLERQPTMEGLVIAMSLIGGTFITTFSGAASDRLGRRPMLMFSSLLFFFSGLIMLWAPNIYILLLARLLDGFGTGLAVTLVPVYISETAPSEIRGRLNTLPQFTGSGGMFLSYCMVFWMSLMDSPSWRLMLGLVCVPSFVYFVLTVFYLPESPRWLVSQGMISEAKYVLQRLRGTTDVSGELALLVEGLGTGGETSMEKYIIGPTNDLITNANPETSTAKNKNPIKIYGSDRGHSWITKPAGSGAGRSIVLASREGSLVNQSALPLNVDPLVTLFGSFHEKPPESTGGSLTFSNMGSILMSMADQYYHHTKNDHSWDEENQQGTPRDDNEDYELDMGEADDNNLRSPLLSRETTNNFDESTNGSHILVASRRNSSLVIEGNASEIVSGGADIGGGWQLTWKWSERVGPDGKKEGELQRIYLHQDAMAASPASRAGSIVSVAAAAGGGETEIVPVAALVSQSALSSMKGSLVDFYPSQHGGGFMQPTFIEAAKDVVVKASWRDLKEPGVKRALIVGIGLQLLQQISGINGVLYYTPQILEQAGVAVLLSNMGMGPASTSLFISAITTLLMLPCIATSMWLMDISGRRSLLLSTIPILIVSLILLVIGNLVNLGPVLNALISTPSVVIYLCCFVMGFGVIPNILCAEIFPTRVRGLCIAICALTYWISNIFVTYSFPVLFKWIGLAGVFGIYAIGCIVSWIFVYLKVPETKGMPLEVISEFFAVVPTREADSTTATNA